jgi:hypothetical protein
MTLRKKTLLVVGLTLFAHKGVGPMPPAPSAPEPRRRPTLDG